jgi:hypothetical protein
MKWRFNEDIVTSAGSDLSRVGVALWDRDEPADLDFAPGDREILRGLAAEVADLAARPIEREKRELWRRHNDLQPTRPVIFCDPENGWTEIIPIRTLQCRNWVARQWEMSLRKEVFWGAQMKDDYVIEPVFKLPWVHADIDWGLHQETVGGDMGGSSAIRWESPIKTLADVDKLHAPVIQVDRAATQRMMALAESVFGDLLQIRTQTFWWWTVGMTIDYVFLRGLTQMMYDFNENPALIHRTMSVLSAGTMSMLDQLEAQDLLTLNTEGYVGSGGLGYTSVLPQPDFQGHVRTQDLWGFAESQETSTVSPRMFAEFIFPYQLPLLERFGLNCYGCCEPLDRRWNVVKQIPRLRRVSVSAWADQAKMAEALDDDYVYSLKPNPSDLATTTFDEERVRADLRQTFELTRGCHVEVIMKDNHTLNHDPQRAIRWVQIAKEEADRL